MSVSGSSTSSASSVQGHAPHLQIPTGGFHLPDLTSLTDTVAYEMWKNTIGFFHLSGRTDELIMPIAYQSIKGDVALDIVTHGPHMNLRELITCLDNNFRVVSDKDTLMKELYTIKQGTKESVKCFDTRIGYTMMRLATTFPHAMPMEQAEETRKTHFLSGLLPNLKSALAWEMCLDGGGRQMTYEEIKDAARWVEEREDPTMSDDPFVRENATPTPQDDGQQDWDRQPHRNQSRPHYGAQTRSSNQNWPAVRAINLEDLRGNNPDHADDSNLGDGADDGGFDPNDYEGVDHPSSTTASLLPPHIKAAHIAYHYEQQEQRCYTCDQTGHFSRDCPVCLKALKDKKGLNSEGGTEHGRSEAPKAAQWGHRRHSSHKVRCAASHIWPKNLTPILNEDARSHWLGRDNMGYAMIKGKWMPVLLDMGANVNMITPECMVALGLRMGPLMDLHEGGTIDQPFNYEGRLIGYVIMSVQINGISGYNEDQVALIAHSSAEFAHHVPVILGTPTTDRAIRTLKESEIDRLATPWACVRKSTLL